MSHRNRFWLILLFSCLLFPVSSPLLAQLKREKRPVNRVAPSRVLVVLNTNSQDSIAIAAYYVRKRHIPASNVCQITCPTAEGIPYNLYESQIQKPIKAWMEKANLKIDYMVLTKGIPIRTDPGGYSPDSLLAAMDLQNPVVDENLQKTRKETRYLNPYFSQNEPFTHERFGTYLVTRLIGYTRADCIRLIENSLIATGSNGPFLFHTGQGRDTPGYKDFNDSMRRAHAILSSKGYKCFLSTGIKFPGDYRDLMGYASWASNDFHYDKKAYNNLTFVPGALAETAVSGSGRTFDDPNAKGQSLIGDLIAQGVTGCKGYVAEPYVDSMARIQLLFDRYTSGYNLAESFSMASQLVHWRDIIIGDPLCTPYAK